MRKTFISTLCELAEEDERIWLLTGDLGYSVLECFADNFPDRYVNVGVAEQNMTGIAAGLALSGKVVFTYSIANFPVMRCLEQIRNDVCYHNLNVNIVAVGAGLTYGTAGYSHYAVEDIAVMRAMPNMVVLSPGDQTETKGAVKAMIDWDGPCYLRLGKSGEQLVHSELTQFSIGKAITLSQGNDVTLITTGSMLSTMIEVVTTLKKHGIEATLVSMPTIKPMDVDTVLAYARKTKRVVTIEEHSIYGGLGGAVSEILATHVTDSLLYRIGLSDEQLQNPLVGSQKYLQNNYGLSVEGLLSTIVHYLNNVDNC